VSKARVRGREFAWPPFILDGDEIQIRLVGRGGRGSFILGTIRRRPKIHPKREPERRGQRGKTPSARRSGS